ncbi:MAG: hypothetical protein JW394_0914 [Nitrospira sp.]|nr:hypothetical protein [Nitrospira sp.]
MEGAFEIGPYVKGALLGGMTLGYQLGRDEALVNVGARMPQADCQMKHTHDLGFTLRCNICAIFFPSGISTISMGETLELILPAAKVPTTDPVICSRVSESTSNLLDYFEVRSPSRAVTGMLASASIPAPFRLFVIRYKDANCAQ